MDLISETSLKKIDSRSYTVDQYSKLRVGRYGPAGVLPIEFFPTYQSLCKDHSRFYVYLHGVVFVLKKVRHFNIQFNRVEGLPISLGGDRRQEARVLSALTNCSWIHKVRCCQNESEILAELDYEIVDEGVIDNFWFDVDLAVARVGKTHRQGRNALNYADKHGGLEWRPPGVADFVDLQDLYNSWLDFKENGVRDRVLYKRLYEAILVASRGERAGLVSRVLRHSGRLIAFSVYLISRNSAHFIMNLSIERTDKDKTGFEKVAYFAGRLAHYRMAETLQELGVKTGFLGWGGAKREPIVHYKRTLSDGESELKIVTIHKPDNKKKSEESGFFKTETVKNES